MMDLNEYNEELQRLYRHFHQNPELGLKEYQTSAFIRDYLQQLGYELTAVPPTGLIAQLPGGIRACYEEDFLELQKRLEQSFEEIREKTGVQIEMEFPKDPVLPFANDPELTAIAEKIGKDVFKERFWTEGEEELFLSGDNAYRYFQKTRGIFLVFLAAIPGKSYPLHHPKFQIDETILPCAVEALYKLLKAVESGETEEFGVRNCQNRESVIF